MMTDIGEAATIEVQHQTETSGRQEVAAFSKAVKELTTGLLAAYQGPLEQIQTELRELTNKQETLISQMQVENKKLGETQEHIDLNELFSAVKGYQAKLVSVKKEIHTIHERTFKLKKRALRLQYIKQKEALTREQQREQELRREQDLTEKPPTT